MKIPLKSLPNTINYKWVSWTSSFEVTEFRDVHDALRLTSLTRCLYRFDPAPSCRSAVMNASGMLGRCSLRFSFKVIVLLFESVPLICSDGILLGIGGTMVTISKPFFWLPFMPFPFSRWLLFDTFSDSNFLPIKCSSISNRVRPSVSGKTK